MVRVCLKIHTWWGRRDVRNGRDRYHLKDEHIIFIILKKSPRDTLSCLSCALQDLAGVMGNFTKLMALKMKRAQIWICTAISRGSAERSLTLNVSGTGPWTRVPGWLRRTTEGRQLNNKALPPASWQQMSHDQCFKILGNGQVLASLPGLCHYPRHPQTGSQSNLSSLRLLLVGYFFIATRKLTNTLGTEKGGHSIQEAEEGRSLWVSGNLVYIAGLRPARII